MTDSPPVFPAKKVLIIGSGIGGLSSGIILTKLGFQVTIIEKNHQPGGMIRSYDRNGIFMQCRGPLSGCFGQRTDAAAFV